MYLLHNPRKKEFVVSELAHSHVSKFLLVGSNDYMIVYDYMIISFSELAYDYMIVLT